jgi:hypothetical protein
MRDPISKITTAKWTGDVTQVVQHLLCKCKALSSSPRPTKKKKRLWIELLLSIKKTKQMKNMTVKSSNIIKIYSGKKNDQSQSLSLSWK